MSFQNSQYLIFVLVVISFISIAILKLENKYFLWIKDHWFVNRSFTNKLSTFFFLISITLFSLSLLDLRGKEIQVKSKTSDERTIVLIDTSASMTVEDVRPNRFEKSLLLVKHFVRRAVGQKISIIVFSDGQKTIVPFTDDYNLLNARIESLKNLSLSRGGTGLSLAIQESIQYFKDTSEDPKGNILIFSDGEENDGGIDLEVPSNISVAMVGVGTGKGGPIPLRNRQGVFKGNKKFQGKEVVSKLNEAYLKNLGSKIKNYDYWIATSYSLPTKEILNFFSKAADIRESENQFRIRPVLLEYLLIPGFIFLFLSSLLKFGRNYTSSALLVLLMINPFIGEAKEEKEPVKSEKTLRMEEAFIKGELSDDEKKAYANSLLEDNFPAQAEILYDEVLSPKITDENLSHHFNKATAQLKNKKVGNAIDNYKQILNHLEKNPNPNFKGVEELSKENLLKALMSQQGQGSGKGEDSEEKNDKKDSKDSDKSNDGEKKKDQKDKEGNENKDQDKKDDKGSEKDKDTDKKEKNESENEKKKRKKKLPALLKQLLSDDNKLQKKMIDAETTERKKRDQKDW